MSLLDKLGVQTEAEAFYKVVDNAVPADKRNVIVQAGEVLAWAIVWRLALKVGVPLTALVFIGFTLFGTGVATPADVVVTAREPGVGYDVLGFCNDTSTKVGLTVLTDAPDGGVRYVALRGTESVNWPDSPPDKNTAATHYWVNPGGVQLHEPVEMTKPAVACFKSKAGVK